MCSAYSVSVQAKRPRIPRDLAVGDQLDAICPLALGVRLAHTLAMDMQRFHETTIERIKEVMREQGVSQVWLAGQIGITASVVNRKLGGSVGITLDDLDDIARALNVPIGDLVAPRSSVSSNNPPMDAYAYAPPDWVLAGEIAAMAA